MVVLANNFKFFGRFNPPSRVISTPIFVFFTNQISGMSLPDSKKHCRSAKIYSNHAKQRDSFLPEHETNSIYISGGEVGEKEDATVAQAEIKKISITQIWTCSMGTRWDLRLGQSD